MHMHTTALSRAIGLISPPSLGMRVKGGKTTVLAQPAHLGALLDYPLYSPEYILKV
jgi:hypothetical protein